MKNLPLLSTVMEVLQITQLYVAQSYGSGTLPAMKVSPNVPQAVGHMNNNPKTNCLQGGQFELNRTFPTKIISHKVYRPIV